MGSTVWTIGHSTRPLDAFLALLSEYRLQAVADVRRFPGSRRYPQYARPALSVVLAEQRIAYRPASGIRRPSPATARFAKRCMAQLFISWLR